MLNLRPSSPGGKSRPNGVRVDRPVEDVALRQALKQRLEALHFVPVLAEQPALERIRDATETVELRFKSPGRIVEGAGAADRMTGRGNIPPALIPRIGRTVKGTWTPTPD